MPLTPEDVHKRTFTPVRLREGYDMGEVDSFLDEVEGELSRLLEEKEDLRTKLDLATSRTGDSSATQSEILSESVRAPEPAPLPAVSTVAEASGVAARLLEIAASNADQLVSESKEQADRIIGAARTTAERLQSEATAAADQLAADASSRSERLDTETSKRREELFGQLEHDRDSRAQELEELRSFEREYRSRLKSYFESQLTALEGNADDDIPVTPAADGEAPRQLRELLGEGQPQQLPG
ncbi:MAG: DivIVA domain-containing protein [Nocardioidaceae bacterium]